MYYQGTSHVLKGNLGGCWVKAWSNVFYFLAYALLGCTSGGSGLYRRQTKSRESIANCPTAFRRNNTACSIPKRDGRNGKQVSLRTSTTSFWFGKAIAGSPRISLPASALFLAEIPPPLRVQASSQLTGKTSTIREVDTIVPM